MLAATKGSWTPYWWLEPLDKSISVTPIWYSLLASMMLLISASNAGVTPVAGAAGKADATAAGTAAIAEPVGDLGAGAVDDGGVLAIAEAERVVDERACAAE